MIFGPNLVIHTVFYKESESEIEKSQILEPGGEKLEKLTQNVFFLFKNK